jgi:hypothetical protein
LEDAVCGRQKACSSSKSTEVDPENVRQTVRESYGKIAKNEGGCGCGGVSCCGSSVEDSAELAK